MKYKNTIMALVIAILLSGCESKEEKNAKIQAKCEDYVSGQYSQFKSACWQEPVAIACADLSSSCMSKFRDLSSSQKAELCQEIVESQSQSWEAREAVNSCKKQNGYEY